MKLKITTAAISLIASLSQAHAAHYDLPIFNVKYDLVGFALDGNLRNTTISSTPYNRAPTYIQAQFNCDTKTVNILGETDDAAKAADLAYYSDTMPVTAKHSYVKIMERVCQG